MTTNERKQLQGVMTTLLFIIGVGGQLKGRAEEFKKAYDVLLHLAYPDREIGTYEEFLAMFNDKIFTEEMRKEIEEIDNL